MVADLEDMLRRVPAQPGVYLMKDADGGVLYVGKAHDLRARVRQYFRASGDPRLFVAAGLLRRALADISTVVVDNDKEALLLENHLIKQHRPRFNVKLRDDSQYLVLRIDVRAPFPRVEVVRHIRGDGARYFGPYHSAGACRETLRFINKHFQLRTCTDQVMRTRGRVCLQYQIKRCPGPCVHLVDANRYAAQVDDVMLLLSGKQRQLVERLRAQMQERAEREQYEAAARLRDTIAAIERSVAKQDVVQEAQVDQDVLGIHRDATTVQLVVMFVRQGKLLGRRSFTVRDQEMPDDEVVTAFVQQYYELSGVVIPDEVIVPVAVSAGAGAAIADWLGGRRGRKVAVIAPARGRRRKLVALANKNAAAAYASRGRRDEDARAALVALQRRLSLARLPRRIECFDVAHISGADPVASRVMFVDGVPDRAHYRTFTVKTAGNDDFAAMYEVLTRRFRRLRSGDDGWSAPDLLILDGGKGQLGMARAALADLGIERRFDLVALAKERDDDRPERVYLPGAKDPIRLRSHTAELFLLARVRDEAHRLANTSHRRRRRRRRLRSSLDDVAGIGPTRRQRLLRHFGSVKAIRAASVDELCAVRGMTRAAAEAVHRFYAK